MWSLITIQKAPLDENPTQYLSQKDGLSHEKRKSPTENGIITMGNRKKDSKAFKKGFPKSLTPQQQWKVP